MGYVSDSSTQWVLTILVFVLAGTCLLIGVAFFRRWQQIRHIRYVHMLKLKYRPILAKILGGEPCPSGVEALRELGIADLEILFEPLFSKRKLPERCLVFLRTLCGELGLTDVWQARLADGHPVAPRYKSQDACKDVAEPAATPKDRQQFWSF